jgi:5-methylcytosine-specific restriction enzyme A
LRSPRVEFSPAVKTEILARAASRCEACGAAIPTGEGEIDHIVAEWTRSATAKGDRAKLTAADGWLLCQVCHARKSKREAFERKRTDGAAKRHAGKQKKGRGFKGWRNFKGEIVWRR